MRHVPNLKLERWRVTSGVLASDASYGNNGHFYIPCGKVELSVRASDGSGWDHVSVSLPDRTPTWDEMCFVKDIFWREDETVIQFHPRKDMYKNVHNFCLHMWKPSGSEIALPPLMFV